jgi:hypothetical protein
MKIYLDIMTIITKSNDTFKLIKFFSNNFKLGIKFGL